MRLLSAFPNHSTTQRPTGPPFAVARKDYMARNLLGEIPDDHFENDPIYPPPQNGSPPSQALLDHIAVVKAANQDKYQPGDIVGGY